MDLLLLRRLPALLCILIVFFLAILWQTRLLGPLGMVWEGGRSGNWLISTDCMLVVYRDLGLLVECLLGRDVGVEISSESGYFWCRPTDLPLAKIRVKSNGLTINNAFNGRAKTPPCRCSKKTTKNIISDINLTPSAKIWRQSVGHILTYNDFCDVTTSRFRLKSAKCLEICEKSSFGIKKKIKILKRL